MRRRKKEENLNVNFFFIKLISTAIILTMYRKFTNILLVHFLITGEIESCDFEPPDGATLETLDKHWQNY